MNLVTILFNLFYWIISFFMINCKFSNEVCRFPHEPFSLLWYHTLSFPDMCYMQIPKWFRLFQAFLPPFRLFPLFGTPFYLPNFDSQLSSISASVKVRCPGSSLCTPRSYCLSHFITLYLAQPLNVSPQVKELVLFI